MDEEQALTSVLLPTLQAWIQAEKSRSEARDRMLALAEVCQAAGKLILLYRTEAPKDQIEQATKEYDKSLLRANLGAWGSITNAT